MINSFNYFSKYYDDFREVGKFYNTYEVPIGKEYIRNALNGLPKNIRYLELGVGTALWTIKVLELSRLNNKELEGVVVDESEKMLKITQDKLVNTKLQALKCDCKNLQLNNGRNSYDLILSALSIDYIGLKTYRDILNNYLAKDGIALFWLYDHRRYIGSKKYIIKNWEYENKIIRMKTHRIYAEEIESMFNYPQWLLSLEYVSLPVYNNTKRGLIFAKIQLNNLSLND